MRALSHNSTIFKMSKLLTKEEVDVLVDERNFARDRERHKERLVILEDLITRANNEIRAKINRDDNPSEIVLKLDHREAGVEYLLTEKMKEGGFSVVSSEAWVIENRNGPGADEVVYAGKIITFIRN